MKKYLCIADNFSRGRLWKQNMIMAIPDDDTANKHFKYIGEYQEPTEPVVIEADPIIAPNLEDEKSDTLEDDPIDDDLKDE